MQSHPNYGSLTLEEVEQLISTVNESVESETIAAINANPEGVTIELLHKLGIGIEEQYLEYYIQAIKVAKGEANITLTIDDLRQAVSTGI